MDAEDVEGTNERTNETGRLSLVGLRRTTVLFVCRFDSYLFCVPLVLSEAAVGAEGVDAVDVVEVATIIDEIQTKACPHERNQHHKMDMNMCIYV